MQNVQFCLFIAGAFSGVHGIHQEWIYRDCTSDCAFTIPEPRCVFKGSGSSASEAGCADAEPLSRLAVDLPTTCAAEAGLLLRNLN